MEKQQLAPTSAIDLGLADRTIDGLRGRLSTLKEADTPAKYEQVRLGISECRRLRVEVEAARKELKQSALEYGRKVDTEAKRVKALISEIEEPLRALKDEVDTAKELERQAKAEAKRQAAEAEERKAREEAEAIAAKVRAEQERKEAEERAKVKAQQEAEAKRLAEERAKLEAEQAEQRAKEAQERAKLEAEREQVRLEREKLEAQIAKKEAAEKKKQQAKADALAAKVREQQAKERLPDREKLQAVVCALHEFNIPKFQTAWATVIGEGIQTGLQHIIGCILDEINNATN